MLFALSMEAETIYKDVLSATSRGKAPLDWASAMKNVATIQFMLVEHLDRFLGFRLRRHLDKAEALGLARITIHDQRDLLDLTGLAEELTQLLLRHVVRQVADVQFCFHAQCSLS